MADIVLTTLNARYYHCAASLYFLKANLGELEERAEIREFHIKQDPDFIASELLALEPRILMVSVYIWNVEKLRELLLILHQRAPDVDIILGGPEVSYAPQDPLLVDLADYIVCGEGEHAARVIAESLLSGKRPRDKMIAGKELAIDEIQLPYYLYSDHDVEHRICYIETSRGCPYKCEYCLSSLDNNVRFYPMDELLREMGTLIDRGVRLFKLLDRTFNMNIKRSNQILDFFESRYEPGMTLHMEFIPDRLPESLKESIKRFPQGALQFEIGVQSYNQDVLDRIKRKQDAVVVHKNIDWMISETGAEIHADLIFGLPGETEESIANGFNQLARLYPQHIQVNLLKLLKGTPIVRHTKEWGMVYDTTAPFEILETSTIESARMDKLRQFARYWTLFHNQGRFRRSLPLIWENADPYPRFMALSTYLFERFHRRHNIDLLDQTRALFEFLTDEIGVAPDVAAARIAEDFADGGRRKVPLFLKHCLTPDTRDEIKRDMVR